MITMAIMAIVMTIVTTAVIQIYRSVNKNEAVSSARFSLNQTFIRLDKEIRYAANISKPGAVGADQYVEFLVTNTGTATCVELRLNASGELQRRSWAQQGGTPGVWFTLASNLSSAAPFTRPAAESFAFQRLRLNINSVTGSGATKTTRQTDITFTALNTTAMNTSAAATSDAVCTEGRAAP